MVNVRFVLLYGIIKFVFDLSVLKHLSPFLLIFITVDVSGIILCFDNENSAPVYNDVIDLTCSAVFG